MIDQLVEMDCKEISQVTAVDASANTTGGPEPLEPLVTRQNFQETLKPNSTTKYVFESRGKAMLRVALREKNKLKLNKLPVSESVQPSLYEQKAARVAQQVKQLTERRRSPKNNVIFTEPVVTQHYEYEPEYDESNKVDSNIQSPPLANGVRQEVECENSKEESKERDELAAEVKNYQKRTNKPSATPCTGDDDDDNELYTLARSDEFDQHASKVLEASKTKTSGKRSYNSLDEVEAERMSDSPPSRSDSSSGGLFSSPKVAKIAPYFDDRPEERRAAEARAILHNRYKLANQRSRSISYRNSNLNANGKLQQLTRRGDSLNLKPRERQTELLSYKKVSSPKVNVNVFSAPLPSPPAAPVVTEPAEKSDNNMENHQPNGYFGWLTTFLTNQMNKLIF